MHLSKTTLLSLVDKLLFSILPGFCFWIYLWKLYLEVDTNLRSVHSLLLIPLAMIALLYIFAFLYWIFLGDTVLAPKGENEGPETKNFFTHFILLAINISTLLYFFPPQSYTEFFVKAGGIHFLGIFLADMLFALYRELQNFNETLKQKKSIKNNILLLLLLIGLYIFPTLFAGKHFFATYGGHNVMFLIPLIINFFVVSFQRFVAHAKTQQPIKN